jgi:phenylacetate-CoA ligase
MADAVCIITIECIFPDMLATPEIIREAGQRAQLTAQLPRWREAPLYREALAGCREAGPECLQKLPLLGKPAMRENFPRNFLGEQASLEALQEKNLIELEHTSGTTSDRLPVIFGRGWWDAQEQRALRLNAVVAKVLDEFPHARRVTITSPSCNGLTCPTVWMSREQRVINQSLFVNLARIPFLISEAELARMAQEITGWTPVFLDADPVHAVWFALYCERRGIRFPSLKFILSSYEFTSVVHRKILTRVFGVPVFNLYGSTETGHLLMENERGEMKQSYDTAYLEIIDRDARNIGDLVVTTLSNDFMPLLRYRIGDLAERIMQPYGNSFIVHGRIRDVLTAGDGSRVTTWQVDQCLVDAASIAHYELRQDVQGECTFRFVPDATGPTEETLNDVTARLETLLQTRGAISAEAMTTLVPAASGKFRLTCRVTTDKVGA